MKGATFLLLMVSALALHSVNGAAIADPSKADIACLKPNCCLDVECKPLVCLPGEEKITPFLECCPVCRPCSQSRCEIPNCGSRQLVLFPGECCPRCDPHCANVQCITPQCRENEHLATPEGDCCPKCVQTCRFICFGMPLICRDDQKIDLPVGKCCQECACNYDNLYCTIPRCNYAAGEKLVIRERESCCPVCEANKTQSIIQSARNLPLHICPDVECAVNGQCPQGQHLITPDGPCCPYCERQSEREEHEMRFGPGRSLIQNSDSFPIDIGRCIGILCVPTFCLPGEVRFLPKGQCCEICVPLNEACASLECEREGKECKNVLEHAQCVSASIQTTVDPCTFTLCKAGTTCKNIRGQAVCVPQFPTQECSLPMQCEPGTVCRVIGGDSQACVPINQPDSCAAVLCEEGTACKIINGRATCVQQLPTQECTFPMQCEPGTVCRVIGGDAQACVPINQPDSCAAVLCEEGTTCKVVSGRATCVPVAQPIPECRRLCRPGTICKSIDGNAVCIPKMYA